MALDAIVVLGCRLAEKGQLLGCARRRVERAALAQLEGAAPFVIVSGGKTWFGVSEADAFAAHLIDLGVAPTSIIRERRSRSTVENASRTAALAQARGFSRLGIVTCDWHMRRALRAFARHGFELLPLPAPTPTRPAPERVMRAVLEAVRLLTDRIASRVFGLGAIEPRSGA
jgi:uncharacterized SAM-binding protein YcdF (DUF218 family)